MKKYIFILFILLAIGAGLAVLFFSQDEKLDQTVFIQTTESIRNLQSLDKNLLLRLNQSRFNPQFDNEQLGELNYQISEEFDNLRYEALFEEIEQSPSLSKAVQQFEQKFGARDDVLSTYIDGNTAVSQGFLKLQTLAVELHQNPAVDSKSILTNTIKTNNDALLSLALGGESDSSLKPIVKPDDIPDDLNETLDNYNAAIKSINDVKSDTVGAFESLSKLETGVLLDTVEEQYVSYHNQAIGGSNLLRNSLIAYGVLLFSALLFFGFKIRQNYTNLEQEVADRTAEINHTLEELQESQEQLIQSEKMASLGQMVAGVAHEINTPLGYVNSNIETLNLNFTDLDKIMNDIDALMTSVQRPNRDNREITERLLQTLRTYRRVEATELMDESTQLLSDGAYGLTEISKLVSSLKDFARLDRQTSEQINLHECIESSITIASNHIRENHVTVVRNFGEIPKVTCFPSKLNQLFLNIITNACQAMSENGGELSVSTSLQNNQVRIDFADQGIGMNQETKQKMFDPFFTTKEIGVGTGLGMSIAYKIIDGHKGSIEVESTVGEGTILSIMLPID